MSPPRVPTSLIAPLPADGEQTKRVRVKPVRRAAIVQCDRCTVNGTGALSGGRLVSTNLATTFGHRALYHRDCGGLLVAFDTAEVDR